MFGSNPAVEDLNESRVYFINYFGFTLIVNIVSLNLLIAVISNTFDSVQSSIEAHHLRTKAGILLDLSQFMSWNRHKSERMYLHIVQNSNNKLKDLHGPGGAEDEFSGRVRVISNKIQDLQDSMKEVKTLVVNKSIGASVSDAFSGIGNRA